MKGCTFICTMLSVILIGCLRDVGSQNLGPQQSSFEAFADSANPDLVVRCGEVTDFATRVECYLSRNSRVWMVNPKISLIRIEFVLCLCYSSMQLLLVTSDGVTHGDYARCRQCPSVFNLGNVSMNVNINVTELNNVNILTIGVSTSDGIQVFSETAIPLTNQNQSCEILGISGPPDDCEEPSPTLEPPTRLPLEDPVCFGPLIAIAVFLFIIGIIVGIVLVIIVSIKTKR